MKHRLQFDFTEDAFKEINELQRETGMPTRAELIRKALRFLQWGVEETRNGSILLVEKNGKRRELIFPFLITRKDNGGSQ